ncbi:tetratricopeptide repeat protein [Haemophilus haemolyticus]|uniref:tetratricopeptide repeat protein n=1 Tax=Haemophilus haemolyticus TaxID=726 RepID=UPI000E59691B|nr:tetratricopeptide repeat protein [Haemophilus haemolyticus]
MNLIKTLVTTVFLSSSVFSFHSIAWANTAEKQFQQGFSAYEKGDYKTALNLWLPLAQQGNMNAQYNLGLMYENGNGVKQSDFEAVKWYRKAAEQGESSSQFNLGVKYYKGEGVKQDKIQAKKWFGKACDNGETKGCNNYRALNEENSYLTKMNKPSLNELISLAQQGNMNAQYLLGQSYYRTKNYSSAAYWFQMAVDRGHKRAQTILAGMYHLGKGVPQNILMARNLSQDACNHGISQACEIYRNLQ